jgi:NTE family protein
LIIGDNVRYNLDYYVDNGYNLSYGFKSQLNQFNKNVTNEISSLSVVPLANVNSINIDFLDLTNQLYFQSIFAQKFLLGLGLEYKYVTIESETLAALNPVLDRSNYTSVFAYMKYDSFDNQYFPTKGWYFSSDLHILKKATLKVQAEAGFSIGDDSIPFFNFVLGGYGFIPLNNFKPFYGYDFLSLAGNSYLKSSATIDYEIFKKNHLNFSANFANIEDDYFKTLDWISMPKYSGYAIGYGLETIIGPLEVKYSWSPETAKGFTWFGIGFWF